MRCDRFLLFLCLLGLSGTSLAEPPIRTSSFFGVVTTDGGALLPGMEVSARVDGVELAAAPIVEAPFGLWLYSIDLPVDDPATAIDEGGSHGETVEFTVEGVSLAETAIFEGSRYQARALLVPSSADLRVTLHNELDSLAAGDTVTWTLLVENQVVDGEAGVDATGLSLTVDLPTDAIFVEGDAGAFVVDSQARWPTFDLAAGETASRSLTLRVASVVSAEGFSLPVTARVRDDGSRGLDPSPSDNVAVDDDELQAAPDLTVTLDDGLEAIDPGQIADFQVVISNQGSRHATKVGLIVLLDPHGLFQTADADGGETTAGSVTWPRFDVAVGQTVSRTFRVLVPADLAVGVDEIEHQASATPGNHEDADGSNNQSTDRTRVEQKAGLRPTSLDLSAVIVDAQSLALAGEAAVHIENNGNLDLSQSFAVTVFEDLDRDGRLSLELDRHLGSVELHDPLAAGASTWISVPVTGPVSFRNAPLLVFVDSADAVPELDETDNLLSDASTCTAPPPVRQFDPVVEMSWPADDTNLEEPNAKESMSTPIVVQLTDDNGDGKRDENDDPDVVFVAADLIDVLNPRLRLRAIDGATGRSHWAVLPPVSDYLTFSLTGLAAGDLDGDGDTEIVVSTPSPPLPGLSGFSNHLTAYDHKGRRLWSTTWFETHPTGSHFTNRDQPTIADLDGNGKAEVIVGGNVFGPNGALRWRGTAGQGYQSARNANKSDSGAISIVVDLDMDGSPEVLAGNTAYRADGTIYWQSPLDDGYTAVGNFDDDDFPEIVTVSRGTVRLSEHDGTPTWGPVDLPGVEPNAGGAPTVADFDGDGEPEIGVAGSSFYTVFETDGSPKWQRAVRDESSNQTGSTVFDFDADGRFEVVYRDEAYLYIFAGDTGQVLFRDPVSSFTANEEPVVADVDGDGEAEILVTSDLAFQLSGLPRRTTGLRVYGDRNGTWVGARSIWNQHAYAIDNVDDDGGIPTVAAHGWLTHNTFRANVSPLAEPTSAPDLSVSYLRVERGTFPRATLTARVGNGGARASRAGIPVSFYAGAPESGGALLGTVSTTGAIEVGTFEDLSLGVDLPTFNRLEIVAILGDDGSGSAPPPWDCRADNDRHALVVTAESLGLWLGLRTDRERVQVGETVTFKLRIGNGSPVPRSGVSLSAGLPEHAVGAVASDGGVISGRNVQWPAGTLAAGAESARTVTFQVDPDLPLHVTKLALEARVHDDGTVADPTPWDLSRSLAVTVASVLAHAGGPYVGTEGSPVVFDGSASLDRNGSVVGWAWDFDGDGAFDDGTGPTPEFTFADDGVFTVRVRAVDDTDDFSVASAQVTVANLAPTVEAGASLAAQEGETVTLAQASFTDPGKDDTHEVTVDWGDGESTPGVIDPITGEVRAGHRYADNGSYAVRVCVRDDDGGEGCATTTASLSNAVPEILDDGAVHLEDWLPQHLSTRAADQGDWQVSDDGTTVTQTENVAPTVLLSPFAVAGVILEGEVVPGASTDDDFFGFVVGFEPGDFENPEADYLLIDWKKGTQYVESTGLGQRGLALSRIQGVPLRSELWSHQERPLFPEGSYEELTRGATRGGSGWSNGTAYRFKIHAEGQRIRVWVNDVLELDAVGDFRFGAGRLGFYNFSQENVTYRAFTAVGEGIVEGGDVGLSLQFLDPGSADEHQATVDWGDGATGPLAVERTDYGGIVTGSHTYPDDGLFHARACVDDGDDQGCGEVPYTVINQAPDFEAGPDRAVFPDVGLVLDLPFTDPGVLDTHEAVIDWGDGALERLIFPAGGSGRLQATKTYAASGRYPVEICLRDNGGAELCDGFEAFWTDRFVDVAARAWSTVPAVRAGGTAVLGVEAVQLGSLPVTGVALTFELPADLTFVSASGGGTYDAAAHRVQWTIPSLGYKERVAFTIEVEGPADGPAPGGSYEITGRAEVRDDGAAGADVSPANNLFELGLSVFDGLTPMPILDAEDRGYRTVEGTTLEIAALIDDPDGGSFSAIVDWGDGSPAEAVTVTEIDGIPTVTTAKRYLEDGLYTLRLCVSDGSHQGCQERFVEVENQAPDLLEAGETVDLRLWQTVDLEIGNQGPSRWVASDDGSHVYQVINSRASVHYSDFPAFGTRLDSEMWLGPKPPNYLIDDDYIGLVLGWNPGDGQDADGDFLLLSWKQQSQDGAKKGLWASRVTGRPSSLWNLEAASGVEVLAKGAHSGSDGWEWGRLYRWTVEYDPHRLRVWLDGTLEIDVHSPEGDFPAGSFGFYNYSQDSVMYRGVGRGRFVGQEGSLTAVRPLLVDGGELDTHSAFVQWGDGTGPDSVAVERAGTVSTVLGGHVYAEDGVYEAGVCAVDDDGGRGCGTFEVEIRNVAPTVHPGEAIEAPFGVPLDLPGVSFSDPGVLDTHTVSLQWGDGQTSDGTAVPTAVPGIFTVSASHVYESALGAFTIVICATDDEGDTGCAEKIVTVVGSSEPQQLTATVTPTREGGTAVLTGTFFDPDLGDTHTSTLDWGDGSPVQAVPVAASVDGGSIVAAHPYRQDGLYPVRWCVTDDRGATGCLDVTAEVTNERPRLEAQRLEAGGDEPEAGSGFHRWQSEGLEAGRSGTWNVSENGRRVRQTSNDRAIFLYGDTPVLGARSHVTARMWNDDDDYIGMALGYEPGDLENPDADYLVVLWKRSPQSGSGPAGLKIARVRGTEHDLWTQSGPGFELLAEGAVHGDRGWRINADYRFRFDLTAERFRVWVNDVLEADVAAPADDPFRDGRFALYAWAQEYVVFRDFEQQALPEDDRPTHFWPASELATWTAEDFWNSDTPANWSIKNDGEFVVNTANSRPSALLSPEDHHWRRLRYVARPFGDNDYFGLVIGYRPGDSFNDAADYLLMVWKAASEDGSVRGLKLYRVTGRPGSYWDLTGTEGVTLLASAAGLGSTAYGTGANAYYEFDVDPRPDGLRVWVNGTLEFDVQTPVPAGRYGLYVYRQTAIRFIGPRFENAGIYHEGDTLPPTGLGFTDVGLDDVHTGTVRWNDGSAPEPASVAQLAGLGTVLAPEHVFLDDVWDGVTVCAADERAAEGCGTLPVRVRNVAPTVHAADGLEVDTGEVLSLPATYQDPGAADTHVYSVDWGDGSAPTEGAAEGGELVAEHVFDDVGTYAVTVCVTDDDGGRGCDETLVTVLEGTRPVILSVDDVAVLEGDSGITEAILTLTLDEASTQTIQGTFETADAGAEAGRDYLAVAGAWTIPAGERTTEVVVEILGDALLESDETILVALHAESEALAAFDDEAVVTIEDDEACPSPSLLVNGDWEAPVPRASSAIPGWTAISGHGRIELGSAASGDAFLALEAAAGEVAEWVQDVDLSPFADPIDGGELDVVLSGFLRLDGDGSVARLEAIFFDDAGAELDRRIAELAGASGWQSVSASGPVPPGSRWVEVWTTVSGPPEGPAAASFDAVALSTLGVATLTVGDDRVYEAGGADAVFPITLSCAVEGPVTVPTFTVDGTAITPDDYAQTEAPVTFAEGELAAEVPVPIVSDGVAEPAETFHLALGDPETGLPVALLDDRGTGTIVDGRPCARSPGYWKTHPEAWPFSWLRLGAEPYGVDELTEILEYGGPDAATKLARALIATRLNLASGASPWMADTAGASDDFLALHPPGSNPRGPAKGEAQALKSELESAYNGAVCEGE